MGESDRDDKEMFTKNIEQGKNSFSSASGMYPIDEINQDDESLITDYIGHVNNHFQAMTEYWKVTSLIPEIKKAIEMIVGDIINVDELNHTFIQNFYQGRTGEDNDKSLKIEKSILSLLKEYNLETRLKKFLETAEITGVKPFSILPSDDIMDLLFKNDEKFNSKYFCLLNDIWPIDYESSKQILSRVEELFKKIK